MTGGNTTVAVAQARSATADDDLNGAAPVVVAVKLPAAPTRTEEGDVESQPQPRELPVAVAIPSAPEPGASANDATTAGPQRQHQQQQTVIINDDSNPDAGKWFGFVVLVILVVGGACWLFEATRVIALVICIPLAIIISCITGLVAIDAQVFALVTVASLCGIAFLLLVLMNDLRFGGSHWRPPALLCVGLYAVAIVSTVQYVWGRSLCTRSGRKVGAAAN